MVVGLGTWPGTTRTEMTHASMLGPIVFSLFPIRETCKLIAEHYERKIHHRSGLRHQLGALFDRQHGQWPRSGHGGLGLRTRHRGSDPFAGSQPGPATSRRLPQGRGSHHQESARRREEIRARLPAGSGHRHWRGYHRQHAVARGSRGQPLAFTKKFANDPAAMAWLWKDHTSVAEAAEITALAKKMRPQYLAKCGGTYSSEWFFSKILHCLRTSPDVFDAAYTWVECADYVPAALTGTEAPEKLTVGVCAAGHKAMYNDQWGGYPDAEFLAKLDPKLGALRSRLRSQAATIDRAVGGLTAAWAKRTGLPAGIPVAVGAFDAHLGAVGSGIATGRTGEDHRHQHLRHDGRASRRQIGGHSRPVRHRQRQHPARLLRPGSRPVGGGRHLQLVRELHSAVGPNARFARATHPERGQAEARRIGPARAGLEQRQPHHPGGSAPHRPAARPDACTPRRRKSTAR